MSKTTFDTIRQIMDASGMASETYFAIDLLLKQIQEGHGREVDRLKDQITITAIPSALAKARRTEQFMYQPIGQPTERAKPKKWRFSFLRRGGLRHG